jgi:hypothetical protein
MSNRVKTGKYRVNSKTGVNVQGALEPNRAKYRIKRDIPVNMSVVDRFS